MDRATSISHALTSGSPATRTLTYDCDTVGNRKWVKRDGGTGDVYGYDVSDQVAVKLNRGIDGVASKGRVAQMGFLSCRAQSRHLLLLVIVKMRDSSTWLGMTEGVYRA